MNICVLKTKKIMDRFRFNGEHMVGGRNISHYHLMNLSGANEYNKDCYLNVDLGSELNFRTEYSYSSAASIFAGLCSTFLSISGSLLNILVILALMKDPTLRKQQCTPPLISLATTDLIYSILTLPMLGTTYFLQYVFS